MCGIVGLYLQDEPVRREQIEAMNATIVHRGPDEDGVLVDGAMGLGMRRLSIIDLEGGRQPIANEDNRIHVIQNGEIYNFRELQKELEERGHRFRTRSDTEVALHAYEEWGGLDFANHLRGMFAIAIWDSQRHELWLARDRIGIKPLYYAHTAAGFAFGSEVKALLCSPIVKAEIEPRALDRYFTFGNAGAEESFIKDVRQLRPGHILRFDGVRTEARVYWEFRFTDGSGRMDEREAAELLRERLREAVRTHMVSDVPIGAFLSGGVDSSAIVGMMAQEGCTNLKTFSIGFGSEEFNELPYAQQVADRWNTDHHTEIVRPEDAIAILDQLLDHLDEPFADASAIPTWYVSKLAAREVKVVLSGDGGDELFAGYTRYANTFRDAWLDRIPLALRRLGAGLGSVVPHRFPGKNLLNYASLDGRRRYLSELTLIPGPLRRKLLRPEWHPEHVGSSEAVENASRVMRQSGGKDPLEECMYVDTLDYLPCDILVKVDRMTMAHSLEARPPLLDHEFVEFAASIPSELKYNRNGRQKHVFKEAVEPVVPKGLLDRKKAGFAVPLQSWFAGPLFGVFKDSVLTGGLCTEYVDPRIIRMLFEENRRGRRDHGLRLWAILVFELWLRRIASTKR